MPPASLPVADPLNASDDGSASIGDPDVFTREPQQEETGATIAPLYTANGDLATFKDYAIVWDGEQWGFVPLAQFKAANLPMRNQLQ